MYDVLCILVWCILYYYGVVYCMMYHVWWSMIEWRAWHAINAFFQKWLHSVWKSFFPSQWQWQAGSEWLLFLHYYINNNTTSYYIFIILLYCSKQTICIIVSLYRLLRLTNSDNNAGYHHPTTTNNDKQHQPLSSYFYSSHLFYCLKQKQKWQQPATNC